jgi:CRISPR-associated protein Cmr1
MRRIVGRGYDSNHSPEHPAGNIFPRALFGLPVLLHFPKEKILNATIQPSEGERLASPLILRPQFIEERNGVKQWASVALLLPYQHIINMQVQVNERQFPI